MTLNALGLSGLPVKRRAPEREKNFLPSMIWTLGGGAGRSGFAGGWARLAPAARMIVHCWAIESRLFHAQ